MSFVISYSKKDVMFLIRKIYLSLNCNIMKSMKKSLTIFVKHLMTVFDFKNIPTAFWEAAAWSALALTSIGFPSGLIIVTVFPKRIE